MLAYYLQVPNTRYWEFFFRWKYKFWALYFQETRVVCPTSEWAETSWSF